MEDAELFARAGLSKIPVMSTRKRLRTISDPSSGGTIPEKHFGSPHFKRTRTVSDSRPSFLPEPCSAGSIDYPKNTPILPIKSEPEGIEYNMSSNSATSITTGLVTSFDDEASTLV